MTSDRWCSLCDAIYSRTKYKECPQCAGKGLKRYTFFFHYNRLNKKLAFHWKGKCHPVENIICFAPVKSEWRNRQPKLIMKGKANYVVFNKKNVIIQDIENFFEARSIQNVKLKTPGKFQNE